MHEIHATVGPNGIIPNVRGDRSGGYPSRVLVLLCISMQLSIPKMRYRYRRDDRRFAA
jgi:hypothetical protein